MPVLLEWSGNNAIHFQVTNKKTGKIHVCDVQAETLPGFVKRSITMDLAPGEYAMQTILYQLAYYSGGVAKTTRQVYNQTLNVYSQPIYYVGQRSVYALVSM